MKDFTIGRHNSLIQFFQRTPVTFVAHSALVWLLSCMTQHVMVESGGVWEFAWAKLA
jgi:hypothetical protein